MPQTRHPRPTQVILFKIALSGESPPSPDKLISLPVLSGDTSASPDKPRPIAKPNRRSQNCKKRLEYTNAMGASYLPLEISDGLVVITVANPKLSLTFCKTPSGRSATEPSTGHFVMNISPPIARLFQAYRHSTLFCGTLL